MLVPGREQGQVVEVVVEKLAAVALEPVPVLVMELEQEQEAEQEPEQALALVPAPVPAAAQVQDQVLAPQAVPIQALAVASRCRSVLQWRRH